MFNCNAKVAILRTVEELTKVESPVGATAKQSSREIYFQIQAFVETPVKVTIELNLIKVFQNHGRWLKYKYSDDLEQVLT